MTRPSRPVFARLVSVLALQAIFLGALQAQESRGSITGQATDSSGAGITRYYGGSCRMAPGFDPASLGFPSSTTALFWQIGLQRQLPGRWVVEAAYAGSLMLTPDIALPALQAMKKQYGDKIWNRNGFADAFHPNTGWVSPEAIGLNAGITLLSAENLRTGNVWKWFMKNPEMTHAMELAGIQ